MPKTEKTDTIKAVVDRFIEILEDEKQIWWSDNLGVSPGVVSNSWKTGKLPRVETLIRLLEIKDISANWFLFGIGPKYLRDTRESVSKEDQYKAQETQLKILKKEEKIFQLTKKVEQLERALKQRDMSLLVSPKKKPADSEKEMFENNFMPMIAFNKIFQNVMHKIVEQYVLENMDNKKMQQILDWITNNIESSQYVIKASLQELEKIFKKKS